MDNLRIRYTPRPDATPEAELKALAAAYRFILDCHAKKKATRPAGPEDARKDMDARTYLHSR